MVGGRWLKAGSGWAWLKWVVGRHKLRRGWLQQLEKGRWLFPRHSSQHGRSWLSLLLNYYCKYAIIKRLPQLHLFFSIRVLWVDGGMGISALGYEPGWHLLQGLSILGPTFIWSTHFSWWMMGCRSTRGQPDHTDKLMPLLASHQVTAHWS